MRLKYRLALLILAAIAVGAAASILLVRRSTESLFRSFVFAGDSRKAQAYGAILADYRQTHGSWEGVQDFLAALPDSLTDALDAQLHGAGDWPSLLQNPAPTLRSLVEDRVVLADSSGIVVADTANALVGTAHPEHHLAHGVPILNDFRRSGTVLVGSMVDSSLTGADEQFLRSVTGAVALSTGMSAVIAVLLGFFLSTRVTRPLALLARSARKLAAGGSAEPVAVSGEDEVAELAVSFNEMTAELKRLDAAKKQVIADSAHELRTPVTLIQGTLEAMLDGVFPRDDRTLASVYEETSRLTRLIDTLRELESIESGDMELEMAALDLSETLEKAVALFLPAAEAKELRLTVEKGAEPIPFARGDGFRIDQVIYNLLSNALKFTPPGGTVSVRPLAPSESTAGFAVEDSGPGIPIPERKRVFERFYRLDKSRSAATGGRGLGLAIAAEIVKAHNGTIDADGSELGGARFKVTLPRWTEGGTRIPRA